MLGSWMSSVHGGMGSGVTEEAGDSFERLTEAEDMWAEWGMLLLLLAAELLFSLLWGFSGGTPELAVAHAPVWQVPMCCHS